MVLALLEQSPGASSDSATRVHRPQKYPTLVKTELKSVITRSPQLAFHQPLLAAPWATSAMLFGPLEQEVLHHRMSLFQSGQPHSGAGSWDRNPGGRAPPRTLSSLLLQQKRLTFILQVCGYHGAYTQTLLQSYTPLRSLRQPAYCCRTSSVVNWLVSHCTCIKPFPGHSLGSSALFRDQLACLGDFLSQVSMFPNFFRQEPESSKFRTRNSHQCLCCAIVWLVDDSTHPFIWQPLT